MSAAVKNRQRIAIDDQIFAAENRQKAARLLESRIAPRATELIAAGGVLNFYAAGGVTEALYTLYYWSFDELISAAASKLAPDDLQRITDAFYEGQRATQCTAYLLGLAVGRLIGPARFNGLKGA